MADENPNVTNNESTLTIENVKEHEETTSPVDVVELMQKGVEEGPGIQQNSNDKVADSSHTSTDAISISSKITSEDASCNTTEDHNIDDIILERGSLNANCDLVQANEISDGEIKHGIRYNGDEYIAVSVNVQTDESWIVPLKKDDKILSSETVISSKVSSSSSNINSSQSQLSTAAQDCETDGLKHITTDISLPDNEDFDQDSEKQPLNIIESMKSNDELGSGDAAALLRGDHSVQGSDEDAINPVVEIDVDLGSESVSAENALSGVGLPYILAYKSELNESSKEIELGSDDILSSNMSWNDLSLDQQQHYTSLFGHIAEHQLALNPDDGSDLISIEPHPAYNAGEKEEKKAVKERTVDKLKSQEVERQRQIAASTNQTNFYTFARQLKTVNYALSSDKCLEEGWTIKPISPPPTPQPAMQYFFEDLNTGVGSTQRYKRKFIQKKYDNGRLFLVIFRDGTGNVWYQSGNLAISLFSSGQSNRLSFLIHEDKSADESPRVIASFNPSGDCTCYNQDGSILVNLTAFGGSVFNNSGKVNKQWKWRNKDQYVHAPPFQPVTFSLTKNFGIRIQSQEQIYVTFSDERKSARFNVGTKLRLKQALPALEPINPEQIMLNERVTYVRSLIERMNNLIRFPKSPRSNKIGLPKYLANKVHREPPELKVSSSLDTFQLSRKKTGFFPGLRQTKHKFKPIKSLEPTTILPDININAVVHVN